jgi:hypothetical protein
MQIQKMIKWIIFFAFFLLFFVLPSLNYFKVKKKLKEFGVEYLITKSNFEVFQKSVNDALNMTIMANDQKIIPEYCYQYSNELKLDSIHVKFLINKLLLVIPEKSCNSCYDEVYGFIQWVKESLNINLIIITEIKRYREIKNIFLDFNYLSTNLYYIDADQIFEGSENIEYAPYFVFLDQDQICRQLFIPHANHSYLTKSYLVSISQKYNQLIRD